MKKPTKQLWTEIDGTMVPNRITSTEYKHGAIYRIANRNNEGYGYALIENTKKPNNFEWLEGMVTIRRGWGSTIWSSASCIYNTEDGVVIFGPGCERVYPEDLLTETPMFKVLYD